MMNRKDFLNLSTRAALFLGLAPAVACSSSQINSSDETQQKIKQLLGRTSTGSAFGLSAPKIDKVRVGLILFERGM